MDLVGGGGASPSLRSLPPSPHPHQNKCVIIVSIPAPQGVAGYNTPFKHRPGPWEDATPPESMRGGRSCTQQQATTPDFAHLLALAPEIPTKCHQDEALGRRIHHPQRGGLDGQPCLTGGAEPTTANGPPHPLAYPPGTTTSSNCKSGQTFTRRHATVARVFLRLVPSRGRFQAGQGRRRALSTHPTHGKG